MDRRSFIKVCGSVAALAGLGARYTEITHAAELKTYAKVKLVDAAGNAIKASKLSTDQAYIFMYPFQGTPNFLINLGHEAHNGLELKTAYEGPYTWNGGVGAKNEIVAFSAICAHQLSYPTQDESVITYATTKSDLVGRGGVITCCAHDSVFDPTEGASVIHGQAKQPLAAISLEYDKENDELYATGAYGGVQFDRFFRANRRELDAELGRGVAKQEVTGTTIVKPHKEHSKSIDQC